MSDYDVRARATAARLMAAVSKGGKGQAITIVGTTSEGTYDPATSTITGAVSPTQYGYGVVIEYSSFLRAGLRDDPGSLIKSGDKQLLISAMDVSGNPLLPQPAPGDLVTLASGATYKIMTVAPLAPSGVAIFYDCNIRGAA